ncbi:MAG: RNA polymerase subunit sigma-70, partial [Clostridia bacterium]|nr:RNA polymerase subunit sigma-70 [Clostridia bacterium]
MIWQLLMKIASSLFYFALHVTPAGSCPPPLKAKEESELLERMKKGDATAKNKLIEHNLRLVAHIVKK